MANVKENYDDKEFLDLIHEAERQAESKWEMDFVEDMRKKFEKYGTGMFLTDRQREALERIANGSPLR